MALREPCAGELDHRLDVRLRVDKPDGTSLTPEFTHVCKRWVKIEPLGTATYANAQQTASKVTHRFYCRYIQGLDSAHEFVGRGRVYRVRRPTDFAGRTVWSVVEVEEVHGSDVQIVEGVTDVEFGFR